ncbi:PD-(D/E)XK nuclease family protein [Bradyrhizobium sp. ARR65]|uniref:PD-(D/E)XK nuclease family protein n=1 Tax=Bradyrhizobium sp. ARR65 TaxID=1040989 RepID=UPI001FD9EFAB|nr:PD-(D/E)XK nuclease family protein [Bradyrhizobium sp. ARR65]
MTMGQVAGRLAGGFLRPIDVDALRKAVRDALPAVPLGELESIKSLPGMVRAAVGTLEKIWRADIDLSTSKHPRLTALAALETEVVQRLPPSMKTPRVLVDLALNRLIHAPAVLGPVEIHSHSEMPVCWRRLVLALANCVPVAWVAGPRSVPEWAIGKNIEIRQTPPSGTAPDVYSCATPQHEVLEAFRWMRSLLAEGKAKPEDIAIAAASPSDYDDYVSALSHEANIPIHFVQGVKAVATPEGQTAAALADVLVNGISQARVRRLLLRLDGTRCIEGLPRDWTRVLPAEAPLSNLDRWKQVFSSLEPAAWPGGIDKSSIVLDVLQILEKGPAGAQEAGEKLLPRMPLKLWQLALEDGPATALPVTLARLHIADDLEPASHPIWAPAISLSASPRPFVRLLALNAGRWPRRISEDRLIPDHVIPIENLEPLPVSEADRSDFATIIASAAEASISFSRRDVEGRLLGRSPLVGEFKETYLSYGRIPEHAASEPDRLTARLTEFRATPTARSGLATWRDWYMRQINAHDGLVRPKHPRLNKVFQQPMSATSLRMLLRDPIRFVWRYALGWRQPEEADEPFSVDPLTFGVLVHETLQIAVATLESNGGFGKANSDEVTKATEKAVRMTAARWETEQPVPPPIIWRNALQATLKVATAALSYRLDRLPNQKSWTEIPFGMADGRDRSQLPWDPSRSVEIPGTGVVIQGQIDRLDLSGDNHQARVIDYKTGRLSRDMADVVLKGGTELQRCLYAFAVRTLLGPKVKVEAALLYPRAADGEEALFPLNDVKAALDKLASAIACARGNIEKGLALPGIDGGDKFNDYAFALPANPSYLARKRPLADKQLGDAVKIWEAP